MQLFRVDWAWDGKDVESRKYYTSLQIFSFFSRMKRDTKMLRDVLTARVLLLKHSVPHMQ